ncbi:unnamed protein product (macronuclear) [Paramecium tetraurelia]|uniref:Transmembrane protein n=1 Tax=Paramecium tetraurelia TaxID=5888 RepID=A0EF48_PARTE|nr:uncharacterized protein GSPATT00026262001 [Paramecium tetraurelia]CAK93939.1 unnamed protein product [Paramecium tetraurelia]|eukprot:XP_001461312.1 hypothetical protein (macronuclear) [Paramecium tetraurelia strain d4-2]
MDSIFLIALIHLILENYKLESVYINLIIYTKLNLQISIQYLQIFIIGFQDLHSIIENSNIKFIQSTINKMSFRLRFLHSSIGQYQLNKLLDIILQLFIGLQIFESFSSQQLLISHNQYHEDQRINNIINIVSIQLLYYHYYNNIKLVNQTIIIRKNQDEQKFKLK